MGFCGYRGLYKLCVYIYIYIYSYVYTYIYIYTDMAIKVQLESGVGAARRGPAGAHWHTLPLRQGTGQRA